MNDDPVHTSPFPDLGLHFIRGLSIVRTEKRLIAVWQFHPLSVLPSRCTSSKGCPPVVCQSSLLLSYIFSPHDAAASQPPHELPGTEAAPY